MKKLILYPILLNSPLAAQEAQEAVMDSRNMEEITVTATRSSAALRELGSRVIILDRDEIEARGAQDVESLLRGLVGLSLKRSGSVGGNTDVSIRGAKSEYTLLIIDGVKVSDASSIAGNFDFGNLQLDDIERVEIVKGPHSVAFASSGMSGAIHLITRKNRLGNQGKIGLGFGSYGTFRQNLEYQSAQETWDAGVQWSALQSQGFNATSKADEGERDPLERQDYQLRLGWNPEENFDGRFLLKQSESRVDIDAGAGDDDPNYRTINHEQLLSVQQNLGLWGRWSPSLNLAQNRVRRRYVNDTDPAHPNDFNRDRYVSQVRQGEFINSFAWDESTRAFVNATWLKEEADFINNGAFSGTPFQETLEGLAREEHSAGLHIHSNWAERVFVQVGGRHIDSEDFEARQVGSLASAIHLIPDDTILRAQVSRGYKSPSLFQLFSRFGSKTLQPEQVFHQEGSLEQSLGSMTASVTSFRSLYDNLIDFGNDRYRNVGRVEIRGQEYSLRYSFRHGWSTDAQYTKLKGKDLELNQKLANRPEDLYAVALRYVHEEWSWHTMVRGQGRSPGGPFSASTKGYQVIDSNLAYFVDDYRLDLKIENIADLSYQDLAGYSAPRRSFHLTGEYRF